MKAREISKKVGLVGGGVGFMLFLMFGLLQGALLGGTAGVQAGAFLFEGGALAEWTPRVLAALGMAAGVMSSAVIFITGGFATGRILGYAVGAGIEAKRGAGVPGAAHN